MAEEKKIIRLADVGELEAGLKKDLAEEEAKGKTADILYCESISDELSDLGNLPTIDPKTLRPVAHWEEIPGSYEVCAGESGSWSVPATRCANPECGEADSLAEQEAIECCIAHIHDTPAVDPKSLRGHARWVKDENVKIITVDVYGNTFESPVVYCENCDAALSEADFKGRVWNYCPVCGFIMEDATNE